MPVALESPLLVAEAELVQRKRWTREECGSLVESGLVDPKRFELIEGELILKVPKNHPHIRALMLLYRWLNRIFAEGQVLTEPSIHLAPKDTPYSDPEPDAIVLNRPYDTFTDKANPEDIVLVIEVSHTTLRLDTTLKAGLYARAGIPDYWVLDINGRRMIVHRDPAGGVYKSITVFSEHEAVSPLAAPDSSVRPADLLAAPTEG